MYGIVYPAQYDLYDKNAHQHNEAMHNMCQSNLKLLNTLEDIY